MPSLIRHKNGFFYIVTALNGKRVWRSLHTRDRREAYEIYLSQTPDKRGAQTPTLSHAQEQYIEYVRTNFSPTTVEVYHTVFKNFNSFIGTRPLEDISTRDIDLYKTHRINLVSANTVNHELRGLRAFFNRLVVWKMLNGNPCQGVKSIRIAEVIRPYLSKEELQKLLDHTAGTQMHDIILLAAMTGLRRGELINLTWQDIDLAKGTILVRSSLSYQTKGGKIRLVPMNSTVRTMLESMEKREGYLFPGDRGGKYNGDHLGRRFKSTIRRCGLNPKLHFHSLRHTFASLLVKEGVSLYHVQRLLGHSSPRVTEIYSHLGSTELYGSVEILSRLATTAAA